MVYFHSFLTSALCPGCFPLVMPWLHHPWYPLNKRLGGPHPSADILEKSKSGCSCQEHHLAHSPNINPTTLKLSNTCQVHSWILYFPVYPTLNLHKLRFTYSESGVDENPYHSKDSNQEIVTISPRLPVSPWSESNIFHYNFNHKH